MKMLFLIWLTDRLDAIWWKLVAICKGWWYWLTDDKATSQMANKRQEICSMCKYNNGVICLQCGCVIKAKSRVKTEKCPEGKWNDQTA